MPPFARLLWPVGVGVGVLAEGIGFGWADARHWVPDLLTGWIVIACGLIAWARRADSAVGPLLAAAGFGWFIGNFAGIGPPVIAWLAGNATYIHRGPLVHALLSYPTGRLHGRVERVVVLVGYLAAVIAPAWGTEASAIGLGVLLILACAWAYRRAPERLRRAKATALQAAAGLGVVLVGGAVGRSVTADASYPALLAYQIVLCAVAAGVLAGLLSASGERAAMTDLVIELDEERPGTLDKALAWALQDPSTQVGFWLPAVEGFVDVNGDRLILPTTDPERAVTLVENGGHPAAAVVHRPGLLDEVGLREAVSTAVRLTAANVELHADVRAQLSELHGSRRRILDAGDEQRRRLERRLRDGAERRMVALTDLLRDTRGIADTGTTRILIEGSQDQLERALDALRRLAGGLHPRALSEHGLAAALAELTAGLHPVVELTAPSARLPARVEATAYFVCSEAMANVAKHAAASNVSIAVTAETSHVTVTVADDGVGGADPAVGSGLRGLADRVEAAGGTLRLISRPGCGTHLTADIPVDDAQP